MSEVVEQVNRYSPVTLEIGDPQLAAVAIGGRFRIGDLHAVLDVLETTFGIQAHRVDEHSIRPESECRHRVIRPQEERPDILELDIPHSGSRMRPTLSHDGEDAHPHQQPDTTEN